MKTKEIYFEELGFFTTRQCEKIRRVVEENPTYMMFDVIYSNCAGNCTLGCRTSYDASEDEIKCFFLRSLIAFMASYVKL